jgi:hypothetical protein
MPRRFRATTGPVLLSRRLLPLIAAGSFFLAGCAGKQSPGTATPSSAVSPQASSGARGKGSDPKAPSNLARYGDLWERAALMKLRVVARAALELQLPEATATQIAQAFGDCEGKILCLLSDARRDPSLIEPAAAQMKPLLIQVDKEVREKLSKEQLDRAAQNQRGMEGQMMVLFGKPMNLEEAIGRNLDEKQLQSIAVTLARYKRLQEHLASKIIERMSSASPSEEWFALTDQYETAALEALFAVRDALTVEQRAALDKGF